MAVMDEFKEEREALKNGTPKQKTGVFLVLLQVACDHCLVVIIMIVSFVKQLTDGRIPLFMP